MELHELLQILACPKCLGSLTALEDGDGIIGLACAACALVYPVREGIPVMLPEDAIDRKTWDNQHPHTTEKA